MEVRGSSAVPLLGKHTKSTTAPPTTTGGAQPAAEARTGMAPPVPALLPTGGAERPLAPTVSASISPASTAAPAAFGKASAAAAPATSAAPAIPATASAASPARCTAPDAPPASLPSAASTLLSRPLPALAGVAPQDRTTSSTSRAVLRLSG